MQSSSTPPGPQVHYSITCADEPTGRALLRQLDISLTTLRATNPDAGVVVHCHGPAPAGLRDLCRRRDARLLPRPPPIDQLRRPTGPLAPVLATLPTIHKFLNLVPLARQRPRRVLLLDCDTVLFGPVDEVLPARPRPTIFAREEVGSSRSATGPDSSYLDESQLSATVRAHGGAGPTAAFNSGVVGLVDFPWAHAAAIERRYLSWVGRFAIWMALNRPTDDGDVAQDVFDTDALRRLLAGPAGARLAASAVPYPSVNRWLVDEVAVWAALGEEPDVAHEAYPRAAVAQGGEPLAGPLPSTVWHYFSRTQRAMEARLRLPRLGVA